MLLFLGIFFKGILLPYVEPLSESFPLKKKGHIIVYIWKGSSAPSELLTQAFYFYSWFKVFTYLLSTLT